jgi:hypothetical protein
VLFERSAIEVEALRALERGSKRMTKAMLTSLLSVAMGEWKPARYDIEQVALRLRYEGRAAAIYRAARVRRYPATGRTMPDLAFNWVSLVANVDAAVYDYEPERYLVGADDKRLEDETPAAKSFANLVRDAQLAVRMPELERRAMAARTMFAQVTWLGAFDESNPRAGKPEVELYWPSDVYVIPHHTRPTDLSTAVALIARRSGPNGLSPLIEGDVERLVSVADGSPPFADSTWFVAWTRPCEEHPDGTIKRFGPWSAEYVNLRGESYIPFGSTDAESPLSRLPWCLYRVGMPQGCPYVDEDRDFPIVGDALNTTWSNLLHVADMQGHDQLFVAGSETDKQEVVLGPDVVLKIGAGETAGMLSPQPKLEAMQAIATEAMRALAVTRRQSPDAYATEPGPPLTGVSRRIANEPQDKARRERAHIAVDFEQQDLLPILMEVGSYWGEYQGLDGDVRPRMTPKDPPDFEDPEARQRRSVQARDAKLISDARCAVESGWYRSEDEAREALDKIKAEAPPPVALPFGAQPLSRAARALEEMEGKPKPEDKDDEEQPEGDDKPEDDDEAR